MYRLFLLLLIVCGTLSAKENVIVRPVQVTLPSPGRHDLDHGFVEIGGARNRHAFRISVKPNNNSGHPWRLFVRALDDTFQPALFGKPTSHLEWKLNSEQPNGYRSMTTSDTLVFFDPSGDDREIRLDLRCLVGWLDRPAGYETELIFTLEFE